MLSWLFVISGHWTIGLEPFVVVPGVVLDDVGRIIVGWTASVPPSFKCNKNVMIADNHISIAMTIKAW